MEDSSSIMIDETYEFSAPRFYDFINDETDDDIRDAELWFETTLSYAPSPFMLRIRPGRSVQLSSLCDFGDSVETITEGNESLQPTYATSKASEASIVSSETKENLNPNMYNVKTSNLVVDQVASVDMQSCEVSSDNIFKDGSTPPQEPTADAIAQPVNHKDSATSSKDVSTPQPASVAKGSLGSSELKKQQTVRKIAAVLKNPSALKCKMQSHLSHTKSAKPSGARRDTSNLKCLITTPNLEQDNQAIKRQKLDSGKSKQILSIKPPNLPHKTRAGAANISNLRSSAAKTSNSKDGRKIYVREQPKPFVSMAEILKKFQSSTRAMSLPQNSLAQDGGDCFLQGKPKLGLTRPKEPEFETAQRIRTVRVKSSAELEEEMMAKMPKFKARPLNKKILEAPALPPLTKSVRQAPEFQEFHLETTERAYKNAEVSSVVSTESGHQKPKYKPHYLTEPKTPMLHTSLRACPTKVKSSIEIEQEELEKIPKFKARPLNKKIFESKGELGLFCSSKKQVTIPQEFHFAIDERIPAQTSVTDLFDKLSLISEASSDKHIPRNTNPNPFHLHTEERGAEKERKFITELMQKEMEEEQARIRKANPYPYTTDYPVISPKPEPKECTKPEPFNLESLVRHEEEMRREMEERQKKEIQEARMRVFKAQPVPKDDPIPLPKKERKPLTQIQDFNLHIEHRAVDRAEFDKKIKEKEMMYKRYREEAEAARQMEEEKALKQLRRTLVPHARPVPNFANPFVPQKSCKEITKAKSPKLRMLRRKERKGLSDNDIRAASSTAAALMR